MCNCDKLTALLRGAAALLQFGAFSVRLTAEGQGRPVESGDKTPRFGSKLFLFTKSPFVQSANYFCVEQKSTLYHEGPAFCCIHYLFSVIWFLLSSAKASRCTSGVRVLFSVLKNPAFACPSPSARAACHDPELRLQFVPVCSLQEPSLACLELRTLCVRR